jgi:hypothetical protein
MSTAQAIAVGMLLGFLLAALVAAMVWMDYLAACDRQRERRYLERSGRPGRW